MRINELARELEIPSKQVIEALPKIGIADKKSHSSKVEPDEVEKIRRHFNAIAEAENRPVSSSRASRDGEELKPKFDLSHISKPGDVLKAIQQKQAEPAPVRPVAKAAAGATRRAARGATKASVAAADAVETVAKAVGLAEEEPKAKRPARRKAGS